jgi:hypothetical protein
MQAADVVVGIVVGRIARHDGDDERLAAGGRMLDNLPAAGERSIIQMGRKVEDVGGHGLCLAGIGAQPRSSQEPAPAKGWCM